MDKGEDEMNKDIGKTSSGKLQKADKVSKDYTQAKPEEIAADIERTRAHMDETLAMLGRKIHRPGLARKAAALTLGTLAAGALAIFGFRALRSRKSKSLTNRLTSRWHDARIFEQVNLARKMAMAARKGKPTIIVVEPRKT